MREQPGSGKRWKAASDQLWKVISKEGLQFDALHLDRTHRWKKAGMTIIPCNGFTYQGTIMQPPEVTYLCMPKDCFKESPMLLNSETMKLIGQNEFWEKAAFFVGMLTFGPFVWLVFIVFESWVIAMLAMVANFAFSWWLWETLRDAWTCIYCPCIIVKFSNEQRVKLEKLSESLRRKQLILNFSKELLDQLLKKSIGIVAPTELLGAIGEKATHMGVEAVYAAFEPESTAESLLPDRSARTEWDLPPP